MRPRLKPLNGRRSYLPHMVEVLGVPLPLFLLLLGVILGIGEAIAPGAHLIVLGVALIVAGLLGLVLATWISGALLAMLMAISVLVTGGVALFLYRELDLYGGKGMARTRDSASLRGRTGRVTERVSHASGQIKLDGGGFNPFYQARSHGGEIPEGEEVIVIDPGGGNVVTVESIGEIEDDIDRELAEGREETNDRTPATERESA